MELPLRGIILSSLQQALGFVGLSGLVVTTLAQLDPLNPKASWPSEWNSSAQVSGALIAGVLLSMLPFNVVNSIANRHSRPSKQHLGYGLEGDISKATAEATGKTGIAPAIDPTKKKLVKLDKSGLNRPAIAWPTVVLALFACGVWVSAAVAGATGRIGLPASMFLCSFAMYISFTPMHDAVHYAVAPRIRWFNDLVGLLASVPFLAMFHPFRFVHLMHHRYSNDKHGAPDGSAMDPDHWAGEGSQLLLPFRWATVLFYYNYYITHMGALEDASGKNRPNRWWSLQRQFTILPPLLLVPAWWLFEMNAVLFWLLPLLASQCFLMYFFDYLPHRPHVVLYKDDPYASTSVTIIGTRVPHALGHALLTPIMLAQNYHNVHHMYPFIPFYLYSAVWLKHRKELISRGTRELPLFMINRSTYLYELRASLSSSLVNDKSSDCDGPTLAHKVVPNTRGTRRRPRAT